MNTPGARRNSGAVWKRAGAATLLCLAAAFATASVPASATGPAQPVQPQRPVVVVDCSGEPQVRPDDYVLACGDGNNRLVDLKWNHWGAQTATARGIDMVNDCEPNCAGGTFHSYPVEVTLSRPEAWDARPDTHRFTTIRLVYPHSVPTPMPHDVTYKIAF
ncbi:hypothetical protein [Streptomyces sp. NPDC089799]|uniref:hypothetical protein n=1 Tax=Streptomyces sp. NPDC089799 TaxID=3155066 RepID=UPI00342FFA4F